MVRRHAGLLLQVLEEGRRVVELFPDAGEEEALAGAVADDQAFGVGAQLAQQVGLVGGGDAAGAGQDGDMEVQMLQLGGGERREARVAVGRLPGVVGDVHEERALGDAASPGNRGAGRRWSG